MLRPSNSQTPPRITLPTLANSTGLPPAIATFQRRSPTTMPTHWLSGDQNGTIALSVPSTGRGSS